MDDNLVTGLIGGALCLFGFSLYMGGLRLLGFFLGASIGVLIGSIIAYAASLEGVTVLLVICGIGLVGGLLGYRFLKALHRVVIILIGAGLGFLLGLYVLPDLGGMWTESWVPFASVIVGGVLFFLLFRYIIILVTTAVGSFLLYQATGLTWVMVIAFAVGTIVQIGIFHRLGLDKRLKDKRD